MRFVALHIPLILGVKVLHIYFFPYQSLLLSTIILNDIFVYIHSYVHW